MLSLTCSTPQLTGKLEKMLQGIVSVCKALLSGPQFMLLKIYLLKTKQSEFTTKLKKYVY